MKKRRIKYFVQLQIPNIFGKQFFLVGVQIDVEGVDTAPIAYINQMYIELTRQLEETLKKKIPENLIVITCLSMLDIMEIADIGGEVTDSMPVPDGQPTMTIIKP
jgi:hypothetical protein